MRLACTLVIGLILVPGSASAAPSAADVLAGVDKTYAAVTTAALEFTQEYTYVTFGKTTTDTGRGWIQRPDLMRWQFNPKRKKAKKPSKVFVASGKTVTVIDHLNLQVLQQPLDKELTPAALSFLTGKGTLAAQFTPAIASSTKTTYTLELTPKQVSAAAAKLTLVVDAETFEVRESIAQDTAGNKNRLIFTSSTFGDSFDPKLFVIDLKDKTLRNYNVVKP